MPTSIERFSLALDTNAIAFGIQLSDDDVKGLSNYYKLLLKWNDRFHLVAPCVPEEFATRHVLESLMLMPHLPESARIVDVGTGAGLPIIPCLIVRDDLRVTLIESSKRKAAFLREALRSVRTREPARVIVSRFEQTTVPQAEFVISRALDRFQEILPTLITWSPPRSTLLLLAGDALRRQIEKLLPSAKAELIPQSERRFLIIACRE